MRILILLILALIAPLPATAQGRARDIAGQFDYYVLALSWQPSWCATTGDARNAPECGPGDGRGFTIHGLWPQYERGWPQYCDTAERDPSRRDSQAMADVMGSGGLAWHQWQKHGRCSGLSAAEYYAATRQAGAAITMPPALTAPPRDTRLSPGRIEAAFLAANPALAPDGVTVTCRDGALSEVRICLTRDLAPRLCAPDVRRDCRSRSLDVPAVR